MGIVALAKLFFKDLTPTVEFDDTHTIVYIREELIRNTVTQTRLALQGYEIRPYDELPEELAVSHHPLKYR